MARQRKSMSIDQKIARAEENVSKSKAKYDEAVAELKQLLEKKDELKKEELLTALANSGKSYDEIMEFLKSPQTEE